MKSYSIAVASIVFAAGTVFPQASLSIGAQATTQPGTGPKPDLVLNASAREGSGQSASTSAGILPPSASASLPAMTSPLTPGIHLVAEIQGTLKAKKLKPGDKIKAQLTQDVILHGKIVAPADSKILGHVTEAKAASDSDRSSRLGIVFDKILLKHHRVLDFKGVIQALAPPSMRNSKVDEPSQMLPPSLMGGGQQNSGQLPGGRTPSSTRNSGGNTPSGGQAGSAMSSIPITAPVRVKTTPGGNPGDGVGGLESPKGAEPISAGLPQGVFGIRGLALSSTPSADTPGPVILSQSGDIKLEWGTQVLLRVAGTAPPPQ